MSTDTDAVLLIGLTLATRSPEEHLAAAADEPVLGRWPDETRAAVRGAYAPGALREAAHSVMAAEGEPT